MEIACNFQLLVLRVKHRNMTEQKKEEKENLKSEKTIERKAERKADNKSKNKADNKDEKKAAPAKGFYYFLNKAYNQHSPEQLEELRKKMVEWRSEKRITKLEKPTRLDRARNLGYKAKKGFVIFRIAIERGGRHKARPTTKRRPKRFNITKSLKMSYQWVAEQRVQKKYRNLEILNSYKIGKDGRFYYFEVIAVDVNAPEIKSDRTINWICSPKNRHRALRGLTSAGKKSRGLSNKSSELKVRPSARAWNRKGR